MGQLLQVVGWFWRSEGHRSQVEAKADPPGPLLHPAVCNHPDRSANAKHCTDAAFIADLSLLWMLSCINVVRLADMSTVV